MLLKTFRRRLFKSVPLKHPFIPSRLGLEKKGTGKGHQFKVTALTLNPGHTRGRGGLAICCSLSSKPKAHPGRLLKALAPHSQTCSERFPRAWRRLSLYPGAGQFRSSLGHASESKEPPQESQVALFNCLSHVKSVNWCPGAKTECPAFTQNSY